MRGRSLTVTLVYLAGLVALFVGERLIGAGPTRWLSAFGVLLALGSFAWRLARTTRAASEARGAERLLAGLQALGLIAVALYVAQSDLPTLAFGRPLERGYPRLAVILGALWPSLTLATLLPLTLVELGYAAVARAPRLELGRIHDALYAGLGLAGTLVFAFSATYVATARDKKADFSYFRTARPGESTRKLVRTLDQPVEVSLFFPPANEVREQVTSYFSDLTAESKLVHLKFYDHAVDIGPARQLGVTGNGSVVVARGTRHEQLSLGLELERARSQLANLDREVQKRLLLVARPQRTLYFTTGHGERTTSPASDVDKRLTVRDLHDLFTQQSYAVRNLGPAEGLATDVPADASAVLVIGPEKPLLAEEIGALTRYVERGGRLLIALDPDPGLDHKALLEPFGLRFLPTLLANDQQYGRRTSQPIDRANLITGSYSSHPSVTTLGRYGMRAPMVLVGAGALEELPNRPKDITVDFTVHAHSATWNDLTGNFAFDGPTEKRKAWELAAALTKKRTVPPPTEKTTPAATPKTIDDGRLVVIGDSEAMSDGVLPSFGNPAFVIDGVKWLVGEEAITGEIASEVDTPIAHTRKQDTVWFYSSVFLAPALVLGVGAIATRRRRRRDREARP